MATIEMDIMMNINIGIYRDRGIGTFNLSVDNSDHSDRDLRKWKSRAVKYIFILTSLF